MEVLHVDIDVCINIDHDCLVKHNQIIVLSKCVKSFFFNDLIANFQNVHLVFINSKGLVILDVLLISLNFSLIK